MNDLWRPLFFSLKVASAAALLVTLIAVPLAHSWARRKFWGQSIIEAVLTVPLVLPPTVVGYFLIVLMGRRGWVGRFIAEFTGGYSVVFHPAGAVLAAAVVSFPLLYLPAKSAFAAVDRELEDVARLMGAGAIGTFWHVSLPMARRGIASGLLLTFARALGEFGATVMVLGELPNQQTLPISIYNDWTAGNMPHAAAAVWTLSGISLAVVVLYNRWPSHDR